MFYVISIVIPIVILLLAPVVVSHLGGNKNKYMSILVLAAFLYFISWYLPSPLIEGRNTSFTTHLVGGGLFTGLLWIYFKKSLSIQMAWWLEAFSLLALVSALGVLNELFELFLVKSGISFVRIDDTSWDLLANTLGAGIVYMVYVVYDLRHR